MKILKLKLYCKKSERRWLRGSNEWIRTDFCRVICCYAKVLKRTGVIGRGNGRCQTQDGECEEEMNTLHSRLVE
ncbi:hypothetical protein TorRG33x02_010250 [Trema orientale]|uniref:Uncharacterized protein n=1 Tax=Trema orientale TaxID=63057 RepID=A0A2P5FYW6_TREOI|nr:hypothetical protein TorRG33x02_010250 [Trema orientale]